MENTVLPTPPTPTPQAPLQTNEAPLPSPHRSRKVILGIIIGAFVIGIGVWLYFGPLAFLKYTNTYEETRQSGTLLYTYDEPGVVYYSLYWYSRAQVGVQPLCCTIDDTLASQNRLYKFSFATHTSEFVSIFNPDSPDDAPPVRNNGTRGIVSHVQDGKVVYGKIVGTAQRYFSVDIKTNDRTPLFTALPDNLALDRVKKLDGDLYLACAHDGIFYDTARAIFLNSAGVIRKEIKDACKMSPLQERSTYALIAKSRDITDLTLPNIYYKISNDGTITEVIPTFQENVVTAPDGQYWASIEHGDKYAHLLPSVTIYHGDTLGIPEKQTATLSNDYLDAIPGQPHFPTKKEAYVQYAKKKLLGTH